MELNREQIVKALECHTKRRCYDCPLGKEDIEQLNKPCSTMIAELALALFRELNEERDQLDLTLAGVMHFVDKWLDGEELKQDEVKRAIAMREKTLRIAEELTEEIERLRKTGEYGVECPACHGIGKILTTNWLTKHLSKEQIAKEKAEAVEEFHRELRADTVSKMQERLKKELRSGNAIMDKSIGDIIDQIAKEMLEDNNG